MLVRRPDVPRINKGMGIGSAGFWVGFSHLTHAQKWQIVNYIDEQAVPPPRDSMLRVTRHRNFSILARCAPRAVEIQDDRVLLDTTRGRLAFDFLILATGLTVDWSQRPGIRLAEAAYPAVGRSLSCPRATRISRRPIIPSSGRRSSFSRRAPGAAPWVEPHSLLHLPGLSEPWADLGRHPGDQRRGGARRERRCERAVRRGL